MLSSWGVTFEGIDVEARPEGLKDLERLGIPLVPATVRGDRWVHGWNPKALAELVDVTYTEGPRLSPEALAQRLDLILAAAQRALQSGIEDDMYVHLQFESGIQGHLHASWLWPEKRRRLSVVGTEGMLVCPEGGAAIAGTGKLRRDGWIREDEEVVVFNTGTGLKYAEFLQGDAARHLAANALPDE